MARGKISLNAVGYEIVDFELNGERRLVHRYDIDRFAQVISPEGPQSPKRITTYNEISVPNLTRGLGRNRIDSDSALNPSEYRHFWDTDGVETRFHNDIRLPILEEDSIETGLEVIRASAEFKGDLWAIWEDDTGGVGADALARKYTGSSTSWTGGGSIRAGNNTVGLDLLAHKTHLIALIADLTAHRTRRSTDGITWSTPTTDVTSGLLSNNTADNEDADFGLLASVGGEAVAILWHEGAGTITFFSSTDAGDTWTDEAVDIPDGGSGPKGVGVIAGVDNEDKLYVLTNDGLWEVDTAPATWTTRMIFPTGGTVNDNFRRALVEHNGQLWFSPGVDDDTPAPVYVLTNFSTGERRIESVGFDQSDGVPDEALGPVNWMKSAGGFLFMSVGGGKAGRNGRIVCWNGQGWHWMRRHGTANQRVEWIDVSGNDDSTPRLHYAIRTGGGTSDTVFLGQPLVNPNSGVSIAREASGYIDLPYYDGGLPMDSAGWLRVGINAIDLSATSDNEYVNVDYGIDDGSGGLQARNNTDLGDFLSGIRTIKFASGAGVSSVNLGLRVNLHRDATTNTDTPKLRDVIVDYLKQPEVVEGFIFQVDLAATAALDSRDTEAVITNLETARDLGTLPIFAYGNSGNKYVKVRNIVFVEDIEARGRAVRTAADTLARRTGRVQVRVEEVL